MSEEGEESVREAVARRKDITDLFLYKIFDRPVTWFNEKVVGSFKAPSKYPYYHRRFKRVPTVDTCEIDDMACVYEAEEQFRRDKKVEGNIIRILKNKYTECVYYEKHDSKRKCKPIKDLFIEASTNYFIKYGDLGRNSTVVDALMKQKHRMLWERRNPDKVE